MSNIKRTYGRGSGERKYIPIPIPIVKKHNKYSRIFEIGHAKYPQSGAYSTEILNK